MIHKLAAILRRDLLTAARYRTAFTFTAVATVVELATFYFLAGAVGKQFRPDGMDYYSFLVVGTGFHTFLIAGVSSFVVTIQQAQMTGTMEVLMTTSTPAPTVVLLTAISEFSARTLQLVLYIAVGLVILWGTIPAPNAAGTIIVFFLSLLVAVSFGVMAASLQVLIHKGTGVVWLLSSVTWLMSGTLFPTSALPQPFRWLANLIPVTHSLNGLRLSLLQGSSMAELWPSIAALAAFAAVLLPLGLAGFAFALRKARLRGTLSFY